MKKTMYISAIMTLVLLFMTACVPKDYKAISLGDYGHMRIPPYWMASEKDEIIYLTDKYLDSDNCVIYMKGFKITEDGDPIFTSESEEKEELKKLYKTVMIDPSLDDYIYYSIYSNSVEYGSTKVTIDNVTKVVSWLEIPDLNTKPNQPLRSYVFLSIDQEIPYETLEYIAQSYDPDLLDTD